MIIRLILISLTLFISRSVSAQCVALHLMTGQLVPVIETPGNTGSYRAFATHRPDGYPIILYGQGYAQLSPLMKQFVSVHECVHLAESTTNEIQANCRALNILRLHGLSTQDEQLIAQSHFNDGELPPQYGGSGVAFWNMTLACAGPRIP